MDKGHLHRKVITAQGPHGSVHRTYWVRDENTGNLRIASGERLAFKGMTGVHPQERINVSYGILFAKRANADVHEAIQTIGKIHSVPPGIRPATVNVTGYLGGANGMFEINGSNRIHISKYCSGPASTLTHEFGHYLDFQLFGSAQSGLRGLGTMRRAKELSGVMTAIYKSDALKKLVTKHQQLGREGNWQHQRFTQYLMMPPELFARAYAQWIGQKAGGKIKTETRAYGDQWARHGFQAQWNDKDFASIGREFDKLFARRNLLHHRGTR